MGLLTRDGCPYPSPHGGIVGKEDNSRTVRLSVLLWCVPGRDPAMLFPLSVATLSCGDPSLGDIMPPLRRVAVQDRDDSHSWVQHHLLYEPMDALHAVLTLSRDVLETMDSKTFVDKIVPDGVIRYAPTRVSTRLGTRKDGTFDTFDSPVCSSPSSPSFPLPYTLSINHRLALWCVCVCCVYRSCW